MIQQAIVIGAMLLAAAPAWAINKCTGADGKVVFQDAPCAGRGEAIDVRPASGHAPKAPPAPAATDAAQATPAKPARKEGAFGATWQRRTYLENRGIPDAEAALYTNKKSCEQKQANNNLAGATYLQSLAAEMQAAATMCDVRSRELNAELDAMKKELRELQARQ